MLTQRTEGLYRLFLLCQVLIVAAVFWLGVWIMVTFYSEGGSLTWSRYSIYCGLLVLGVTLETLSRSRNTFLQNELLRPHRLSLRQTGAAIGLLVLYLVAAKDAFISRIFLFNLVPWLYIALLFSHYYLPSILARGIFRREDKTILIGPSQRAAQLRNWLERKAEIGFRTIGLISDDDKIDNVGVPLLGRRDQLEQIIRDHGINQAILLEFPLFSENNQDVIQVCDQLGDAPTHQFLPVGNAGNITAYWAGYKEYKSSGLSARLPKMMGYQAAESAPIVLGLPIDDPHTVATAIKIGNPASWKSAEAARD